MTKVFIPLLTFSLIVIFTIASCNTDTPKYKFSRADKTLIDSLFRKEIPVLKIELDSLCEEFHQVNYQKMKDSITEIRLSEIEQFLPE